MYQIKRTFKFLGEDITAVIFYTTDLVEAERIVNMMHRLSTDEQFEIATVR